MPSTKKILFFLTSAVATSAGVAILGYGMSSSWSISAMECSAKGNDNFNGTADIVLGIFNGKLTRKSCPSFDGIDSVEVLEELGSVGGAPLILHAIVVGLLAISLLGSAGSILITLYNSFSNPYETYMGPLGLYACSSVSGALLFLVLVLFLINTKVVGVPQQIIHNRLSVDLRDMEEALQVGFYLLIPSMVCNLLAILSVFMYQHQAYTQRKEQQRPTEDAPKEIMMY